MGMEKDAGEGPILPVSSNLTSPRSSWDINDENESTPFLSDSTLKEVVVFLGEFMGTFMFLFMSFAGTQIASNSSTVVSATGDSTANPINNASKLLYISFAFGISLAVNVWIFARVSGGMFNPAVSFALVLAGALKPLRALHAIFAQLLAAMAAAFAVDGLMAGKASVSTNLADGVTTARGFFLEFFLTAQLVIAILMLAIEKHGGNDFAPFGIGLALFISEMASVYYTGGSLNPARSFGPAVVEGFKPDFWIYCVAPLLGAALSAAVYRGLKWARYDRLDVD